LNGGHQTVAVLGGGVAGLSAAHELSERGFEVVVYEARNEPGGKARSMAYEGSGRNGRRDLPGEHGFRFFPGFYRHLPDTMRRIPHGDRPNGVFDNLVAATRILMAQAGGRNELLTVAHLPESLEDFGLVSRFLFDFAASLGIPPHDHAFFVERLLTLLTSCEERRYGQWEHESWWDFIDADVRSPAFRKFLADGTTRSLVAARAREMSARTGGYILLQLLFDLMRAGGRADRVLNGPTSDVWIDPWVDHLTRRGVNLRLGHAVEGVRCSGGQITGVTVTSEHGTEHVTADHYVAALPVEIMRSLVSQPMREADPRLARLGHLVTRWMNGVMLYLDTDVPLVHGHAIYIDSEWALTSISQQPFWPGFDLESMGDGRVEGILSIDVSDWERPGRRFGKVASRCTREEIKEEVWGQLKEHLNDDPDRELHDENLVDWFLDPAIEFPNPSAATNAEPLLVNTAGSWDDRPDAVTRIPNLFLASDYVRTFTDLATMEGANEAARRAVNGILERSGSRAPRCAVWPLSEPSAFAPARAVDRIRWRLFRRAPKSRLRVGEDGALEPAGPIDNVLLRWAPRLMRASRSLND
jgi:uncharacterized protein with NAD-binding domain and iron-sulfur cluster